ncbi:MAG: hypothetical protein IPM24_26915 [Bryobacterales bacterium]|nr:hypothetical protein [Bryobacterales bacterium]
MKQIRLLRAQVERRGKRLVVSDAEAPLRATWVTAGIVDDLAEVRTSDDVAYLARRFGFLRETKRLSEPISDWLDFCGALRAILAASRALDNGLTPDRETLVAISPALGGRRWKVDAGGARLIVAQGLNRMMQDAAIAPSMVPDGNGWRLSLTGTGWVDVSLLSLLRPAVYFLVQRVMGRDSAAFCSICGGEIYAERARPAGRNHYCQDPDCRKEMWRRLKADQRRKPASVGGIVGNPSEK